jgi:hypothetical protein
MQFSRRAVLASGTGVIAGFSGCSHTLTDTPTPENVAKVFIAKGVMSLETRGATLYGQLHAQEMTAGSLPDGGSFDPKTGSFSVSGENTAQIEFKSGTLRSLTILSEQGVFDIFAQGKLVKQRAQRATIGSGRTPITPEAAPTTGNSAAQNRIYISRQAAEFVLEGASVSGQIGAEGVEGRKLETSDNLDTATGSFAFQGTGRDIIRFNSGTLRALSVIVEEGTVDVFYRGQLLEQRADQFSRSFQPESGEVENGSPSSMGRLIDNFEDQTLGKYFGDSGAFSTVLASNTPPEKAVDGGRILQGNIPGVGAWSRIFSTDGLSTYPAQGTKVKFSTYWQDETAGRQSFLFGVQDSNNYYSARIVYPHDEVTIHKFENGSATELDSSHSAVGANQWNPCTVIWEPDGVIAFSVNGDTVTATDTDYTGGGIGWAVQRYSSINGFFDYARITETF